MTRTNTFLDEFIAAGPRRVLDHGFLEVVDYMGDDRRVLETARTSTAGANAGLKGDEKDRALLRFLLRKHHTTPFESVVLTVRMRLPLFVARQLVRYRMATLNEESARYSELGGNFYLPDLEAIGARPAAGSNRQGRGDAVDAARASEARKLLNQHNERSEALYRYLMAEDESAPGIALELARLALPVSVYTTWVWTINLHSLTHILRQRLAPDAQYETRAYAEALAEVVRGWCPWTWEAFEDYQLGAVMSSRVVAECVVMTMRTGGGIGALRRRLTDNVTAGRLTASEANDAFASWSAVAPLLVEPDTLQPSPLRRPYEPHNDDADDFVTAISDTPAPEGFVAPLVDPDAVDWSAMSIAATPGTTPAAETTFPPLADPGVLRPLDPQQCAPPSIMFALTGNETPEQIDRAARAFRAELEDGTQDGLPWAGDPDMPTLAEVKDALRAMGHPSVAGRTEAAPSTVAEQPAPVEGQGDMWAELIELERNTSDVDIPLVSRERYIAHMQERRALGIERYGRPVQIGNGRDVVLDLFQEVLDATVYLHQLRRTAAGRPSALALESGDMARVVDECVLQPMAQQLRRQGIVLAALLVDGARVKS